MKCSGIVIRTAATCLAWCGSWALGSPVTELEGDGMASNNTLSTAEALLPSDFTPNADATVFGSLPTATVFARGGDEDVDFFSFFAGPGVAYFDVDAAQGGLDTYLALFDGDGTLLGDNDDSFPPDPGSITDRDAFLGSVNLPGAGIYYLAVAASGNFANATFTGSDFSELVRPDGEFGGFAFDGADVGDSSFNLSGPQAGSSYRVHVTIPEPAGLLLISVSTAMVLGRGRMFSMKRSQ